MVQRPVLWPEVLLRSGDSDYPGKTDLVHAGFFFGNELLRIAPSLPFKISFLYLALSG